MKHLEKQKVINLRMKGMTISEIQRIIPVSKSTISSWIDGVLLSEKAKSRIKSKITLGQIKSREILKNKSKLKNESISTFSVDVLNKVKFSKELAILLCSCLYEGEGRKGKSQSFTFTNSDPKMIRIFLKLFRQGFTLDESKFRVCVHLHLYHDEKKQKKFWSDVTHIPIEQFMKSFIKKNSGLYRKVGYQGCISIRYYDIYFKKILLNIFNKLEFAL